MLEILYILLAHQQERMVYMVLLLLPGICMTIRMKTFLQCKLVIRSWKNYYWKLLWM